MSITRRRRFFDMLRRPGATPSGDGVTARRPLAAIEDAMLWSAHEQVTKCLDDSAALSERVATSVARHRAQVDGTVERAGAAEQRSEAVRAVAARVDEVFDKLALLALNAGLDGVRSETPEARALSHVATEVRGHAARGDEVACELRAALGELEREIVEIRKMAERGRGDAGELGHETSKLNAAMQHARQSAVELGLRLRKATGIDPEVARAVHQAADHARGLMSALSALTATGGASLVKTALGPVVVPLGRMLAELGAPDAADDDEPAEPS